MLTLTTLAWRGGCSPGGGIRLVPYPVEDWRRVVIRPGPWASNSTRSANSRTLVVGGYSAEAEFMVELAELVAELADPVPWPKPLKKKDKRHDPLE